MSPRSALARAVLLLCLPVLVYAAPLEFDLPAQPLAESVKQLARNAGITISADDALLAGRSAPAVRGRLEPEDALRRVLAGSGLDIVPGAGGSFVIHAVSSNVQTLSVIEVVEEEAGVTTEDSGSYAASSASLFKGASSLREIPQSVSVMTRTQMDDQNIVRLDEAFTQIAGLRLDGYASEGRVVARGYDVSTQEDGVPFAAAYGAGVYRLDPAIYDRVEVLRGPSGLLTGSGEPGGTINLARKRPRADFGLTSRLSLASWDDVRLEADVTNALNSTGSLRARAVAVWQDRDMFYDVAHERRTLLHGAVEYDITGADTVGVTVTRMNDRGNNFWGLPRYSDGTVPGRRTFVGVSDQNSKASILRGIAEYEHRFANGWVAHAAYSDRKDDFTQASFYSTAYIDPATGLTDGVAIYGESDFVYTSYDVYLSGPLEWFGREHQFTVGYNRAFNETEDVTGYYPAFTGVDVLTRHDWGGAEVDWPVSGWARRTKQSGLYGSARLRVLEPLSLIVGGRWTDYISRSRASATASWVDGARSENEFTPYGAVIWDISEPVSVYGSYAEIFAPQTAEAFGGNVIAPREGQQYELGIKGSFFFDQLNASLAVYQMRDVNRALEDPDATHVCTSSWNGRCSIAAGKVQSRGIEAEISGSPTPGLGVTFSYTLNRTKYLRDTNPDNEGRTLDAARNPKHLAKFWAQYDHQPGALSSWVLGAGVLVQSRVSWNERVTQGGYALYSAKVGYRFSPKIDVSFDVDNLFDKTYMTEIYDASWYNIYGTPRSLRLSMTWRP